MYGEIDGDEIRREDERLFDQHNDIPNRDADRQFLEIVQGSVSVEAVIRDVERQYWRDVLLTELEEGEDGEYLYVFEEGPVHHEPRWLQNNVEIPMAVLDRYRRLVDESSLPEELKKNLMMTLRPPQTIDWKDEGF